MVGAQYRGARSEAGCDLHDDLLAEWSNRHPAAKAGCARLRGMKKSPAEQGLVKGLKKRAL